MHHHLLFYIRHTYIFYKIVKCSNAVEHRNKIECANHAECDDHGK